MNCCVWKLSILFRNRSSSFSVSLPRSACPIVSIVSEFYDQYTLASHISHYRSTIKHTPVTKNTSKFEQLQQRRPERSQAHEDFVCLSFAKPIGKLQYRDMKKTKNRNGGRNLDSVLPQVARVIMKSY